MLAAIDFRIGRSATCVAAWQSTAAAVWQIDEKREETGGPLTCHVSGCFSWHADGGDGIVAAAWVSAEGQRRGSECDRVCFGGGYVELGGDERTRKVIVCVVGLPTLRPEHLSCLGPSTLAVTLGVAGCDCQLSHHPSLPNYQPGPEL